MAAVEQSLSFRILANILDNNNGNSIDISKNIKNIVITKDYINNVFPLFIINMQLTEEERDTIRDNNTDISLKIYSGNTISEITDDDMLNVMNDLVLDTIIRIYDKKFTTDTSSIDENNDDIESSDGAKAVPMLLYTISGIPKDIADGNATHVNMIYDKCKAPTALLNIISSMPVRKDIYFDSLELSSDMFNYILIPPQTPISAISYLDDNYKIYKNGRLNTFYDTNCIYLYNLYNNKRYFNKTLLYKEIDSQSSNTANRKIEYDVNTNRLIVYSDETPSLVDSGKILAYNTGTSRSFYSYDDTFDIVIRNGNKKDEDFEMNRYFWNPGRKQIFEKNFDTSYENGKLIPLTISGVDIEFFTPDTVVMIESPYSEISGHYNIGSSSSILSSNNGHIFSSIVTVGLYKTK